MAADRELPYHWTGTSGCMRHHGTLSIQDVEEIESFREQLEPISDRFFSTEEHLRKAEERQDEAIAEASMAFRKHACDVENEGQNLRAIADQASARTTEGAVQRMAAHGSSRDAGARFQSLRSELAATEDRVCETQALCQDIATRLRGIQEAISHRGEHSYGQVPRTEWPENAHEPPPELTTLPAHQADDFQAGDPGGRAPANGGGEGTADKDRYCDALSRAVALRTEILERVLLSYIGENAVQLNLPSTLYALGASLDKAQDASSRLAAAAPAGAGALTVAADIDLSTKGSCKVRGTTLKQVTHLDT